VRMPNKEPEAPVAAALAEARRRIMGIAGLSGTINLLTLSGPIYMLQVYDRVLPSRNVSTLLALSTLVLAAYALQGCLDAIRSRMLTRISALLDASLQEPIYAALMRLSLKGAAPVTAASDVLELYGVEIRPRTAPSLGPEADALLARLRDAAQTADELLRAARIDPGVGAVALTALELAGRVTVEDGVYRAAI